MSTTRKMSKVEKLVRNRPLLTEMSKNGDNKFDKKLTKCRQIEDKIRIWSFYFKIKINPSHKTKSMILTQLLTLIKTLHFELPSDDVIGVAILCCL